MSGIVGPRLIPTPPTFADTKSFQFDGVTDYINASSSISSISSDSQGTISLWAKADVLAGACFSVTDISSQKKFINMGFTSSKFFCWLRDDGALNSGWWLETDGVLLTNTWYHLAVVQNGVSPVLYVDGVAVPQTFVEASQDQRWISGLGFAFADNIDIGRLKTALYDQNYFEGLVDGVSYFSSALSSSDILTIFNGGVPNDLNLMSTLPKIWYRMGEEATWNGSEFVLDNQGSLGGTATSVGILPTDPNPTTDVPLFDNKSFTYDGVSDAIEIGTTSLGITNSISVSAWVKIPTTNTGGGGTNIQEIICEDTTSSGQRNWALAWRGTPYNRFQFVVFHTNLSATAALTTSITPNDGNWHHVLGTFDGTTNTNGVKLYIDGVLNNQTTALSTGINSFTSSEPNIGRLTGQNQWNFEGDINDVSVFDNDQSANASTIFNGGVANNISTLSPLGYWRAEQVTFDGTDWTLIDQGSGGNNGTSSSMPLTSRTSDVPLFDNKSFTYDGISDYFQGLSTYSELDGLDKATFSFWIKPPSTITSIQVISSVMMSASSSQRQYQIQLYTSGLIQYDAVVGGNYIRANSTALNLGQWNHVLFCIDTTQVGANRGRVFINGVDETGANTISGTLPTSTTGLFIGKQGNGQYNNFNGGLDEFAIWAGTDLRNDVAQIYNDGVPSNLNLLSTSPTTYIRGEFATWDGSNWSVNSINGTYALNSSALGLTSRTSDVPT